jgi:hypothetical protein
MERMCIQAIGWKVREKRPLGGSKRKWVEGIKMDFGKIGWGR